MPITPQPQELPALMASSELWGRPVRDTQGRDLGTIDSIARTAGGAARATVRSVSGKRRLVLVDLSASVLRDSVVVVPAAAPPGETAERAAMPHRELAGGGSQGSRR